MLQEAIEKIVSISQPIIKGLGGSIFAVYADGEIKEIKPELDLPSEITLNSLDSLVKMVKTEALVLYQHPVYVTVPSHLKVECFAQPDMDKRNIRLRFYTAKATDVPGWEDNVQLKFDEAMIAIRTRFEDAMDSQYTLKLLSDITTGSKVTYNDNGVATSVVTKTGVALQTNEAIKPIVTLKPYRTFQEVEQPASQFLIRINERGINFVEADGGMWKLRARETIKAYLDEAFSFEIEQGTVIVAL